MRNPPVIRTTEEEVTRAKALVISNQYERHLTELAFDIPRLSKPRLAKAVEVPPADWHQVCKDKGLWKMFR